MTREEIQRHPDVGKPCKTCGEIVRLVELDCQGAKERGEPMPLAMACRCCHGGDFICNCGKPCWSFF